MEQVISTKPTPGYQSRSTGTSANNEDNSSGVSWAAVIAGGLVTAALSLILLALGTGLGLSSISFWSNAGMSAATIGTAAILWLILMQIMSSSMGGYLAGRLRTKWANVHTDEVYFRDTAHGFLAWAVALVVTAGFLASAASSMVGSQASDAPESRIAGARNGGRSFDLNEYFTDTLFRSDSAKLDSSDSYVRGVTGRIFANALRQGDLSAADRGYLDHLVAMQTGLNQTDADKRISDVFARAQQTAEMARKALAHLLLWTFLALLIGAFCASFAATIGGRQRDHVVVV
jgi:hypothetical protein